MILLIKSLDCISSLDYHLIRRPADSRECCSALESTEFAEVCGMAPEWKCSAACHQYKAPIRTELETDFDMSFLKLGRLTLNDWIGLGVMGRRYVWLTTSGSAFGLTTSGVGGVFCLRISRRYLRTRSSTSFRSSRSSCGCFS